MPLAGGTEGPQRGPSLAKDLGHAGTRLAVQVELLLDQAEHLGLPVGALAKVPEAARERRIAVLRSLGLIDERVDHARLLAGHLRQRRKRAIELADEFAQPTVHIGLGGQLRFELLHHLGGLDWLGLVDLDRTVALGRRGGGGRRRVTEEEAADRTAQRHRGPYCIASMRPVTLGFLVFMLVACGDRTRDGCRGAASLSPAITSTIVALGAGGDLVGRTPWCVSQAPVVGSLLDLDAEALVLARPCVILVQPPAQGIDGGLEEVAARLGAEVHAWPLATMTDIRAMVRELPRVLAPDDRQIAARASDLLSAMDRACAPMSWDRDRRVLVVQAGDGRLAFGPSTYLGEFLMSCGVPNALAAGAWQTLDIEEMVTIKPSVVLTIGSAPSPWTDEVALRTSAVVVKVDDDTLLVPSGALGMSLERVRAALEHSGNAEPSR